MSTEHKYVCEEEGGGTHDRRSSTVVLAEAHDGFSSTVDDQREIDIFLALARTLECACV